MAAKTCIQEKYATKNYKNKIRPQRHQRECKFGDKCTFSTKCSYSHDHESKSTPDGRVTKLTTHVDTLKAKVLGLKEDNCRKSRNLDEDGNDINKTIKVKIFGFTTRIQNLKHMTLNMKVLTVLSVAMDS